MGVPPHPSRPPLSAQAQLGSLLKLQEERDKSYNAFIEARSRLDALKVEHYAERVDTKREWKGLSPAFALKGKQNIWRGEIKVREHSLELQRVELVLQDALKDFRDDHPGIVAQNPTTDSHLRQVYPIRLLVGPGLTNDITTYHFSGLQVARPEAQAPRRFASWFRRERGRNVTK